MRGVRHTLWLLAGLVLVASLLIGPGATAGTERASAGTVVFIHDQEPPNLQGPWVGNNLYATASCSNNIWYGCQIRDATGRVRAAPVHRQAAARQRRPAHHPVHVQAGCGVE